MRLFNKTTSTATVIIVCGFVMLPLFGVVAVSFSAAQFISFPWDQGFSPQWYGEILEQDSFLRGAANSLLIAVISAAIAVVLGCLASVAVTRGRFRGRQTVLLLGSASLFIPEVLFALALLIVYSQYVSISSMWELVLAHTVLTLPFVLRVVVAALQDFSPHQEEAAENLGATPLTAFFRVTLPQMSSALFAAALMAFIVSFDNVTVSLFIADPGFEMLPVELYAYALNSFDGIAAAISVVMIVLSLVGVLVVDKVVGLEKVLGGQ
jgi:putative spermidine/putrescine transport system permease protein